LDINLLCIGDVVGKPGRSVVSQAVPKLIKEQDVHCVIANVENAAAGSGLTELLYNKFLRYGVDLMTLGDHIYKKAEILPVLEKSDKIVRPANYPPGSVGHEYAIGESRNGARVAVISLMGRLFMKGPSDCPYAAIDRVLAKLPSEVKVIVVDMHAEATSEKIAMGWHLAGRVSVVFGTHTHVQTADECILEGGTAYITDLGMSGPYDGVLGRRKDRVLRHLITGLPGAFDVSVGDPRMCGIKVTVDSDTGRASHIERVCFAGTASANDEPD
jgi:metallophosphoesterase (TIGR00282 family)